MAPLVKVDDSGLIVRVFGDEEMPLVHVRFGDAPDGLRLSVAEAESLGALLIEEARKV